ncbi:type II toxin-antitoxin system RelE/ParE family toxin [Flavobacterium sp.]|uniref:type II toxin-antitoxin system RelE/ParE family toxin n=1 Tax=Flavobacterium sp. TaxID=239 RepID=UPI003D110862
MAQLKVYWTETAISQRDYVLEYWVERNKNTSYSKSLYKRISERVTILKKQPFIGKPSNFKDTRVISLGHYSIFYKPTETKIIITAFWDNRQEPEKLLNFLNKTSGK